MKLKSFGCSFVFGTDLADDGRNRPYATGSRLTWPALIAEHFGYAYETYARPGSGNLQILERLLCQIDPADPAIYVIGWTYIDRFDYVNDLLATPWPGTKWSTLMPIDETEVATNYFRHLSSEYADKLRNLVYIKTAIDSLKQNDCQFVMTYMDPLISCQKWHTTRATRDLQRYIEPYLNNFAGKTFLQWSRDLGFDISDTMHPLEPAHQAAADLVLANWNQYLCHSA
jgi:hypothetical protein